MDVHAAANTLMGYFPQRGVTYEEVPYTVTKTLPIIGRVRCVNDSNGQMQVFGVFLYWVYGTFSLLFLSLLPHYHDGRLPMWVIAGFLWVSAMCLLALLRASTTNPGQIPNPDTLSHYTEDQLTFCDKCQHRRPKRAHHCRRCGQCVMKMDHHCPWINNCVGEGNHHLFVQLLFYAMLLGLSSFVLCMVHFWAFPKCTSCDKDSFFIKHSIWFLYIEVLLGANMALMMGMQLAGQHFNLLMDRTTLENMMHHGDSNNVVLRSCRSTYTELCGSSWVCCWLLPFHRRKSVSSPHQMV